MISLYLDNEKRYCKNFNGFGIHEKQSFLAKIEELKYF